MDDRRSAKPPLRGNWFLRLARQRRLFHSALLGGGGSHRRLRKDDAISSVHTDKPGEPR